MSSPIRPDSPQFTRLDSVLEQAAPPEGGPSFADTLTRVVNDTQQMQGDASQIIGRFVRGEPVELHQVMAASEEAGIALSFLVEMRNKLTDAYRTVMNMQI
ncbi:MAG TPA: flagellar hook-basal body complex protein FliE [Gemmatimonadales bacterium]|nr:flagellar hook-basal body complex protein FliE [Gemmatimonadales bacterium]